MRRDSLRPASAARVGVIVVGAFCGVVAVTLGSELGEPIIAGPDFAVGLAYFILGSVLWTRSREAATLAVAVGITWYFGSFLWIAGYWHRGPLIHLVLLMPLAGMGRRVRGGTLFVVYVTCLVPAIWNDAIFSIAASAALVMSAWLPRRAYALGPLSPAPSRWAATTLAASIIIGTILGLAISDPIQRSHRHRRFCAASRVQWTHAHDLVVELDESPRTS